MSRKQLAAIEARFQDNVLSGNPMITAEIEGGSEEFRASRLAIYRSNALMAEVTRSKSDEDVVVAIEWGA